MLVLFNIDNAWMCGKHKLKWQMRSESASRSDICYLFPRIASINGLAKNYVDSTRFRETEMEFKFDSTHMSVNCPNQLAEIDNYV